MTTTRILPGVVLLAIATAGPAAAQFRMPPYSPPGRSTDLAPPAGPAGASDPVGLPGRDPAGPAGTGMPAGRPPTAVRLDQMTSPVPPGVAADPVGTLTGPAAIPAGPPGLPPGAYGSPWHTDAPGCCGPIGRNGLVAYEVYLNTALSFPFGSGPFTDRLFVGGGIGGGGRSMFFNPEGDAAWLIDLGLSYTYNRGSADNFADVFIRQPAQRDPTTGQTIPQPDILTTVRIRGLHRTSFNYSIGRDWFHYGPGLPGGEPGWNVRTGTYVGGRWGTAHVDLVPIDQENGYSRRQKVFQGLFLGAHVGCEVPMGGWIWFGGVRTEWGYDWMDIVPPLQGDVMNVNILLTTGVRF